MDDGHSRVLQEACGRQVAGGGNSEWTRWRIGAAPQGCLWTRRTPPLPVADNPGPLRCGGRRQGPWEQMPDSGGPHPGCCSARAHGAEGRQKQVACTDIHRQTQTDKKTYIHRHTQTYTDIHRHHDTHTDIHRRTQTYTDIMIHTETQTQSHRHRHRDACNIAGEPGQAGGQQTI